MTEADVIKEAMSEGEESMVEEMPGACIQQGATSHSFRQTFKTIIQRYKQAMVVVMEPQISGRKADNFIKASGFARSHRVEAIVFSCRIWLLWRDQFDVEITFNHKQFIHLKLQRNNVLISWITTLYASPVPIIRRELWDHLNHLATITNDLWIVGGDFNSIIFQGEKIGGLLRQAFKGPRYTWSRGSLSKRLDRVVCNKAWFLQNPNASVLHLPKVASDHRPVLIRFDQSSRNNKSPKLFRFMATWLTNSRFTDFMKTHWNNEMPYYRVASEFIQQVQHWNKNSFGNIFQRKKVLLVRIGGVQRALER
ncbi:uncharacterized protein LOC107176123 [Citrus sinensis]|uniref:uncharacterized protein LOC107176123 n=1 Tax=Citrus sinensis TaxID=2711 RepID=UPI0007636A59|nr:uncharacterized protein LOC107176123 [Citrus sinensis]